MDRRNGIIIRALRKRSSLRQQDVADAAGVSQSLVSLIERGHLETVSIATLRKVIESLDAGLTISIYRRGGELDRLLDQRHAEICTALARRISRWGWKVLAEVSYSEWGERGSIDLLAWHQRSGSLLVIEVKSRLGSVEATLRKLDEKGRLAPVIGRRVGGWTARTTSRVLVLPANTVDRRLIREHRPVIVGSLPLDSNAVRRWVRRPTGEPAAGVWFLAPSRPPQRR